MNIDIGHQTWIETSLLQHCWRWAVWFTFLIMLNQLQHIWSYKYYTDIPCMPQRVARKCKNHQSIPTQTGETCGVRILDLFKSEDRSPWTLLVEWLAKNMMIWEEWIISCQGTDKIVSLPSKLTPMSPLQLSKYFLKRPRDRLDDCSSSWRVARWIVPCIT
jgi:hypothetical protein